jgi:hypothetical protein
MESRIRWLISIGSRLKTNTDAGFCQIRASGVKRSRPTNNVDLDVDVNLNVNATLSVVVARVPGIFEHAGAL